MTYTHEPRPAEYRQIEPGGFLQVIVLLAGAMFQCSSVPRIQFELQPKSRDTAAWLLPFLLATVQGTIFLLIGLVGYHALGECLLPSGDVFASYSFVADDIMVTILQGGIALLMYLSLPLLAVSPKNELWTMLGRKDAQGKKIEIEDAGPVPQVCLALLMTLCAVAMPMFLGRARLTNVVTILGGIAANWTNLFLPAFVIIYAMIIPEYKEGKPVIGQCIKVACILAMAIPCFVSAIIKIIDMFGDSSSPPDIINESTCWNATSPDW